MTHATDTPVEHVRLVQCGRSWFPEQRDATFDESADCWDFIGWLLLFVAATAAVLACVAFGAGYWLVRWGLL